MSKIERIVVDEGKKYPYRETKQEDGIETGNKARHRQDVSSTQPLFGILIPSAFVLVISCI